eukprot:449096-Rhodomonas_salina.1
MQLRLMAQVRVALFPLMDILPLEGKRGGIPGVGAAVYGGNACRDGDDAAVCCRALSLKLSNSQTLKLAPSFSQTLSNALKLSLSRSQTLSSSLRIAHAEPRQHRDADDPIASGNWDRLAALSWPRHSMARPPKCSVSQQLPPACSNARMDA